MANFQEMCQCSMVLCSIALTVSTSGNALCAGRAQAA